MSERLAGRTAVITGAARGIGSAVAALFLREGARVGLVDLDRDQLPSLTSELARAAPPGAVLWRAADIGKAADVGGAIAGLAGDLGGLDILVNNAAARAYGGIADATPESWDAI